jgi:hypothetical protein
MNTKIILHSIQLTVINLEVKIDKSTYQHNDIHGLQPTAWNGTLGTIEHNSRLKNR